MPSSQAPPIGSTAIDPTALRPAIDDALIIRTTPAGVRGEIAALKEAGYTLLLDIGGVDYLERDPRYDVVYHLLKWSGGAAARARVLCGVSAGDTVVPTISDMWPNADWPEREIYDLFGITFSGHPDLRRIQMPEDWAGHPLRRDYPLRGPALERTPRPSFALKSNVAAGTPASGKTAAALQRQIAAARGQALPDPAPHSAIAAQSGASPGAVTTAAAASTSELAAEKNAARGGQLPKDGAQ
ncbi:MAG: NADH-quinone oxidoreductase subunit C [Candidatus Velthaea sp.]